MLTRGLAALATFALSLLLAEGVRGLSSGPAGIALAVVASLVAVALAASPSPLAVGLGALGALGYAALRPSLPLVGAAVLGALAFGGRAARARYGAAAVTQLAVAALVCACAAWVLGRFEGADLLTRTVALGVATLLAAAPFALAVEDPRTHALLSLAGRTRGPARLRLLRAAALRRRGIEGWDRGERAAIERAFLTVERLGAARAGGISSATLEGALADHVAALGRACRAVRARHAAREAVGAPRAEVEIAGERIASEAAALDEICRADGGHR